MKWRGIAVAIALAALQATCATAARAHRIDEYLQATLVSIEADRIVASMRLVPGERVAQSLIAEIDQDADGLLSPQEQRAYAERVLRDLRISVDGRAALPRLVAWRFPAPAQMREGLAEIDIDYAVDAPRAIGDRTFVLVNEHRRAGSVYLMNVLTSRDTSIRVVRQRRDSDQSLYALDYRQDPSPTVGSAAQGETRAAWDGLQLAEMFRLGMRHIAFGADHLTFLLTLLLTAPLLAVGGRWRAPVDARRSLMNVAAIATAFTVGHSLTLAIGAIGGLVLPTRLIETTIGVSILVSALHAARPLFPEREAIVAGAFGLVHGLAFATTLDHLDTEGWRRVADLLAFNGGIEAMQLIVVAAIMPSLLLLSRYPVYRTVRLGGAAAAGVLSVGWILQASVKVWTPADVVAGSLVRHAGWIAAALFVAGLTTWAGHRAKVSGDRSRP